jgi:hypothetical protein
MQKTKQIKREFHSAFKLCSHWLANKEGSFLCFQARSQLYALVEVFGETVLCNIWKQYPCVDESVKLLENDKFNVVVGSQHQEDPFKDWTVEDAIDFRFDGVNELQVIDIQYLQNFYKPSVSGYPSQYLRCVIE